MKFLTRLSALLLVALLSSSAHAAVAFRAVANAISTGSPSQVTITKPTGTVENDCMYAVLSGDGGTITPPGGWTIVQSLPATDADQIFEVYQRVAGGAEGANYQFSLSGVFEVTAAILTYSGCDTASPVNTSSERAGVTDDADPQTVTATAITPSVNDSMILYFGSVDLTNTAATTWTVPSTYTERFNEDGIGSGAAGLCPLYVAELLQTTATSTGAVNANANNDSNRTGETLAILVAIPPPGGSPPAGNPLIRRRSN
jgi:hypothetical protein